MTPPLPAALITSLVTALLPALLVASVTAPPGGARGLDTGDRYGWPLPGPTAVVRGFDPPPQRFGRGHRGVDLAAAAGVPVFAAATGTVLFAGPVAGRPVVSIQHDGRLRSTYEPVLPVVSPGDRVTAGQRIGALQVGHPECAVAACLHWGLLRGDEYLDPLQLLAPGPLRLLPWNGPLPRHVSMTAQRPPR